MPTGCQGSDPPDDQEFTDAGDAGADLDEGDAGGDGEEIDTEDGDAPDGTAQDADGAADGVADGAADDAADGADSDPDGMAEDGDGATDGDGDGDGYGDGTPYADGEYDGMADAGADEGQDDGGDEGWEVANYTYDIVNSYPHDHEAFTQGLVFLDGELYEGTGLYGSSSLRRVALETGEVLQSIDLGPQYFGEGIAIWQDKIIQLTYTSRVAFVYDKESFAQLDTFSYESQGWGLTHDGTSLIMSDGSSTLYFRDPDTFELTGTVDVHDPDGPVLRLNELEYIDGQVFANVFNTDRIVMIEPASGRVTGVIDLSRLLSPQDCSNLTNVLNGIAYDSVADRLFVTGKLWCKLFEIELVVQKRH